MLPHPKKGIRKVYIPGLFLSQLRQLKSHGPESEDLYFQTTLKIISELFGDY